MKLSKRTCDIYLEFIDAGLARIDNVHDAVDDFDIEVASQPALHKPSMHQRASPTDAVTPHRRVSHPPRLQNGGVLVWVHGYLLVTGSAPESFRSPGAAVGCS